MDFYQFIENKNKPAKSIEQIETKLTTKCVVIDSRDRNRDYFASSNNYMVYMNSNNSDNASLLTNLKNIFSIKLVECILPVAAQNYSYITLVIPELQDTMVGTNDKLKKAFSILVPERVNSNFISCKITNLCNCSKTFNPPLSGLNRMTLEFYAPDGTLVNFGTDNNSSSAPNDLVQNFLIMEFNLIDPNMSKLDSLPLF